MKQIIMIIYAIKSQIMDLEKIILIVQVQKKKKKRLSQKSNTKRNFQKNKNFYFEKGLYSLYIVPFKINEYSLIRNIHENNNHRNWEDTRKEFKKQKYYYRGYINDFKYIVSNCTQCNQKNFKFYKKEKYITILFDEPKDRYVIDLTIYQIASILKINLSIYEIISTIFLNYRISSELFKSVSYKVWKDIKI